MTTLAFALAATIKHDGHGGIADLLSTPTEAAAWLADHQDLVARVLGRPLPLRGGPQQPSAAAPTADAPVSGNKSALSDEFFPETRVAGAGAGLGGANEASGVGAGERLDWEVVWRELVGIRRAVRALFARAVAPRPPSKADADRLMDADAALRLVNRAAERLGSERLEWPEDGEPVVQWARRTEDPVALLVGAVGRSAIDFLASPDRARLRACPAARCVKYFLQDDPRQTWCSPACGNRERVNRHYRKRTSH